MATALTDHIGVVPSAQGSFARTTTPPDPTAAGNVGDGQSDAVKSRNVHELFRRARDARRPLMAQWRKNYRTLNKTSGYSAATGGDPGSSARREIPKVFPIVASFAAWMTDQRPSMDVIPSAVPNSDFADYYQHLAEQMNVCIESSFSVNKGAAQINRSVWDVCTYGIAYFKTGWKSALADGLGDGTFWRVDPFTVYPDPFARNEDELNYVCEAHTMSVVDMERLWPGSSAKIGPGGWTEDSEEAPHALDASTSGKAARIPANLAPIAPSTAAPSPYGTPSTRAGTARTAESPIVTVIECWYRTTKVTTEDVPNDPASDALVDPETGKSVVNTGAPKSVTRVRDVWRVCVVVGDVVLEEGDAEDVSAFNTHPYDRFVLFDTGEWYGPCLVAFLASSQDSLNDLLTSIQSNLLLVGNPIMMEAPNSYSAVNGQKIGNRPGQRIKATPQDVSWLIPPTVPQMSMDMVSFYDAVIESISGMSAIVRGFSPGGRNSADTNNSIQDAAMVRVRATLRELERALDGVGNKLVATIAEFYTTPRFVALGGQDGYQASVAFHAQHFYVPDADAGSRVPMRFMLRADAGSQLPTSQQARSADAETLYGLGVIDREETLKAKQWPNWKVVAQRMDAKEQAAALQGIQMGPGKRAAAGH